MYAVNASIPKTLVRHSCATRRSKRRRAAKRSARYPRYAGQPRAAAAEGRQIAQKTEDLVGPYALHDYFLYYMLRFGFTPRKIYAMALRSFAGMYDAETIKKWLRTFYRRFFTQQFKSVPACPDGPKVGSVTLSPRGISHAERRVQPDLAGGNRSALTA